MPIKIKGQIRRIMDKGQVPAVTPRSLWLAGGAGGWVAGAGWLSVCPCLTVVSRFFVFPPSVTLLVP